MSFGLVNPLQMYYWLSRIFFSPTKGILKLLRGHKLSFIHMNNNDSKKETRECGKGETIRKGANIQKYVDNYDRIFRKNSSRKSKSLQKNS